MFRPIRKKKNEISMDDAKILLTEARRGVLAVNGDDGYPYAIPVNYFYDEDTQKLYFHGSRVGHKAEALKKCDKVCFTVLGPEVIKAEKWAPFVRSVAVFGRCRPIDDPSGTLIRKFAMKYYPDEKLANEEIAISGRAVQMYEIEIEHLSGKEVQER
ncbi:MAG: pyridoxamine 5'-phosphate oxidase family protein [Clostridia bacterium]|nr:pyridoxamine 5'-phosphate oxidase family protein [Clostridia bacterium]